MDWFHIELRDDVVHIHVAPPGSESWSAAFALADIERVVFEAGSTLTSDTLYVFVRGRDASYTIPTMAVGGSAFFGALMDRGLFDAQLAIRAATADEGELFFWPLI
jgi:hypothetical protein